MGPPHHRLFGGRLDKPVQLTKLALAEGGGDVFELVEVGVGQRLTGASLATESLHGQLIHPAGHDEIGGDVQQLFAPRLR